MLRQVIMVLAAVLITVGIAILFLTSQRISADLGEYAAARDGYHALREVVIQPTSTPSTITYSNEPGVAIQPTPISSTTTSIDEPDDRLSIDFDALLAINPDTAGWIFVCGSDISYPIVQSHDNSRYLNYTFDGLRNRSGAIFLDYRDRPDFLSLARVYGHDMQDGSMFGSLYGWQGDKIIIYTPYARFEYAVTERGVMSESQVLMLADNFDGLALITCVSDHRDARYVVIAVRDGG